MTIPDSSTVTNDQSQPTQTPPVQPTQQTPTAAPTPAPAPTTAAPTPPSGNNSVQKSQPTDDGMGGQAKGGPSLHARIFDKILKGMSGGDIKIVGPNGDIQTVPQSHASMGKSIVAAALTGLMTPTHYRNTPYGPVIDYSATMADSMQRGQTAAKNRQQQAQNLSDEQQSKKLTTLQNNAKLLQLQVASSNLKHVRMEQSKSEIAEYMKPFQDYNAERNASDPSTPNAFLFQGMTHQDALTAAKQHGLTETNIVQDGWKPYSNSQTHEQEWEPTYAAINPGLKDVNLSPEVAKRLSDMNSQYQNIHEIVGGDVKLPVGMYVSAMHDYQALQQTQDVVNRLNMTLNGPKAKDIDIASIVKSNRNQLVPALYKIQQAVGAGHGAEEGENPANILDVILGNAPQLLAPLGLTTGGATDKVTELTAKRTAALTAAKNIGTPKEAADPTQVNGLLDAAQSLTPDQQKTVLPTLKGAHVTKQDIAKATTQIATFQRANQSAATRQKLMGGDPEVAATTAKNIMDGALADIPKLASMRSDAREVLSNAVVAEAKNRGLDIARWSPSALQSKSDMWQQYHSTDKNKVGAQLSSFRVFLDHTDDALQANDNWKRASSPLLNKPLSWIAENATDDPNWIRYKESFLPVAKEFMTFLNQNRAEHDADIKSMDGILNMSYTPLQAETALKAVALSADKRLADLAYAYNSNMGTTMPEMLTPSATDTLKRLDSPSKALKVIQRLPKGNGGKIDPQNAAIFKSAAGGDVNLAREMAKQAGWGL